MKIWDAFIFRNDFEVLELRLEELWDVVDEFVLVESNTTFRGHQKRLEFAENAARFAPYRDKLHVVTVTDSPTRGNAWSRELFQRNAIMRGLAESSVDDVVLISDVDEIPDPDIVRLLPEHLNADAVLAFEQAMYYYSLNWRLNVPWYGTRAVRRARLDFLTPQGVRAGATATISNGGWHFSYLFPKDEVVRRLTDKVRAFSHAEYDNPDFLDPDYLAHCVEQGYRWADSGGFTTAMTYDRIGPGHPAVVQRDQSKYRTLMSEEPLEPRRQPVARQLNGTYSYEATY